MSYLPTAIQYTKASGAQQVPATGLTVTYTLIQIALSNLAATTLVNAQAATEITTNSPGVYVYSYSGSLDFTTYFYIGFFKTTDATVQATVLPSGFFDFALSVAKNSSGQIQQDPTVVIGLSPTAGTVGEAWLAADLIAGRHGTAQAGAATTITLDSGASSDTNAYVGDVIKTLSGTGSGQHRTIVAYNSSTKIATVNRAWDTNPDNTTVFQTLLQAKADVYDILSVLSPAVAGYVGPDWSHVSSPTSTVGLTGTTISSSQVVASVTGAVGSVTGNVGGTVSTVTTLTNLPSIPSNWLTAAGIAASALNGKGDWLLSSSYTAPNNAGIATIISDLGTLSTQIGSPLQVSGYTAPNNAGIATIISDLGSLSTQVGTPFQTTSLLPANGLDNVQIESGISASAALVNDAGTQLTSINLRQALALSISALCGKLTGAAGPTTDMFPAALPGGSARIIGSVDTTGRTSVSLRVPN